MSILLDAVNRKKQQQGDVVDFMSTPRPQYASQISSPKKVNKFSVLAIAIALGMGAAWGMSEILKSSSVSSVSVFTERAIDAQPVGTNPATQPSALVAVVTPALQSKMPSAATQSDEIRLAGKVALPIAKPFNNVAMTVATTSTYNANTYTEPTTMNESGLGGSYPQSNLSQAGFTPSDYSQPTVEQLNAAQSSYQNGQVNRFAGSEAVNRPTQVQQQDSIVIGTNANRRSMAELDALRMQVNAAAQEVDFASVKASPANDRNKLLSAFETALKDVEFEQSANQSVTVQKLDPIPKSSNKQIPKYGDLPASVQLQVPEFNINAHVYSSEPTNRWLNVDGVELQQGGTIQNKLTIVEIRPRDIILEINGEQFRVPAI